MYAPCAHCKTFFEKSVLLCIDRGVPPLEKLVKNGCSSLLKRLNHSVRVIKTFLVTAIILFFCENKLYGLNDTLNIGHWCEISDFSSLK